MISELYTQLRQGLANQKLSRDIAYTLVSFMVLAISGIIINITITLLRDPAALGVFNLAYAVYIIASQFAVMGIQYSVLRHAAYYQESPTERGKLLLTACICSIILGILYAILIYYSQPLFYWMFKSESTANAIAISAFGLAVFPLNKILISYLNALHEMKAFSILQGLRYITVMVVVALIAASSLSIDKTAYCFIIAELTTAILAIIIIYRKKLATELAFDWEWSRRHLFFGTKSLMAGMFSEINSRLDVLLIGFFLSDHSVGVYSFAAMLVDGLYHILAMIRINFNPLLVTIIRDQKWDMAQQLRQKSQKYILPIITFLAIAILLIYAVFTLWIVPQKGLQEGLPSLAILLCGLVSVSFLVPFDNLMMVSGHPGYQTTQQILLVAANLTCASILLPFIGIEGAAIGTVIGYLTGTAVLIFFAKKLVGWGLLSNTYPRIN